MAGTGYEAIGEVVPGVLLCKFPNLNNIYVRVYRKGEKTYTNRSTGKKTPEEARLWALENLATLFQVEAAARGGGTNSISRLLTNHLEFLRKRKISEEIAPATFLVYEKAVRHFQNWFRSHGYKRLGDIKRTSLLEYGLDRTTKDGMSPNTVNLELVYLKMWWTWLQETEVISRPLTINKLKARVENRAAGEPFATCDLEGIYKSVDDWIKESAPKTDNGPLPTNSVSIYNKKIFLQFIKLLDESGCRQHEVMSLTWKDVVVLETNTRRARIINQIKVPHRTKRGFRIQIFKGDSIVNLKALQRKMCPEYDNNDFIFRNHQTNTLIDPSTFSRYWSNMNKRASVKYKLHTLRSHRITQLVLSGVEAELVARNLGLSVSQLMKTYLRFVPAAHFEKLIQKDRKENAELRTLIASQPDPLLDIE